MKTNTIAASVLLLAFLPAASVLNPAWAQSPAPASAKTNPGTAAANNAVSLNFVNADIDQVIAAIGLISGRNFLIDPRVKGTLNIVSAKPVPRELTYQILLSSLRLQGYAAVEANGVTTILPESDAKLHGSQVNVVGSPEGSGTVGRPAVRGGGNRLITQVYPLKHESASQLVPILRPLIAPNNTIAAYTNNNTLVITDYAENIARLTKIIDAVDQPQDDVVVMPVLHGSAVDLAATLNRLYGDGTTAATATGGDASQRFSALAEHRSNHVLIRSGNASKIAGARQLLTSLDVPGAAGNIHVVYLKNAEATKVAQTLRAVMSGDTSATANPPGATSAAASAQNPGQGTVSGSGIVQADAASNALIITAPDATYNNLRRVIDQLDRRRAQVFVEALIAEVSAERAAEFGIQWQSTKGIGSAGNPKVFGGTNFGAVGQNIIDTAINPSTVNKGLNLMVTEGTLSIPGLPPITNLGVLARLLESDTKTNILSTPNLVTLDNEEAKIVIGQNVPFVTGQFTSAAGAATNPFQTVERRDVGLVLKIKPQISEGGSIKLLIAQEVSSVTSGVGEDLVTNKRSLDSTVLIDDGAIIALGGLIQDSYQSGVEKVPFLGDIPFLGALFRYETRKRTRTNLVIFLRPQILRDRNDYSGLTQSRYDFVVGEQTRLDPPGRLMKDEPPVPVLPEVSPPATSPAGSPLLPAPAAE